MKLMADLEDPAMTKRIQARDNTLSTLAAARRNSPYPA